MKTYMSVDALADLKWWWQHESWPLQRGMVRAALLAAIIVAGGWITRMPRMTAWHEERMRQIAVLRNPTQYEAYEPTQLDLANLEQTGHAEPVTPPAYRGYVAHTPQGQRHKRRRAPKKGVNP